MNMLDVENWNSRVGLIEFIADRLTRGHLLPFVGSGISIFAGLSKWNTLLESVGKSVQTDYRLPTNFEAYTTAEGILQKLYKGNRGEFYKAVHKRLYSDVNVEKISSLIQSDSGMRALTMLCHRSVRGGSRFIFTLNYDDLLELILRDLGLVVQSVGEDRFLFGDYDVSILHPHGLLPLSDIEKDIQRNIVIAQSDASRVSNSSWKPLIEVLLSKSFPIFIGIGGTDIRFLDYLDGSAPMNYLHNVKALPFIGVRLCSKGDEFVEVFESKKIKCIEFEDLSTDWPKFVEDVCRKSAAVAEARMKEM